MPTLSRIFLKLGLLYFVLAMLVAAALAWVGGAWSALLLPTYLHLFMVGWVTQCIVGVALWLFPKWSKEQPRGPEWLGWTSLVGLNLGLVLRAVAEPMLALQGADEAGIFGGLLVVSAIAQWAGGLAFAAAIWPRIKDPKAERARRKKQARAEEG
ncbi:hypothetical protein FRC98_00990 [Lujinxingia vulgaris]|uniref:Uncharacterized protein n=1 Tax=Lujinxingia vulgaris TaxID=2600176 RepID=A0A5C6XNN5_9DELT|nr:hypothetical protein [Lujinxingia vulgaris]TXD39009.1 hypothetical protein FRC98_00990 [Lujinxingia vulgaris]